MFHISVSVCCVWTCDSGRSLELEFLAQNGIEPAETRSATKQPVDAAEALTLLEGMTELRVAKGKKVVQVDLSAPDRPPNDELVKLMVSRWGKLRAPTMKVGTTLVVGHNRDMLAMVFATDVG